MKTIIITAVLSFSILTLISCASPTQPTITNTAVPDQPQQEDQPTAKPPAPTDSPAAELNPAPANLTGASIIANHTSTNIGQIPAHWLEQAKKNVIWIYGSTSHGTQLWTGAEYLSANIDPPTYAFAKDWWDPPPQGETPHLSMGYDDGYSWDPDQFIPKAREMLENAPEATAFMWSWCGEMGYEDTNVQRYLDMMSQLEREYPHVRFVYMTGHTGGDNDTLDHNNDLIRRYIEEHEKVLYDFAAIESFDPDGNQIEHPDDSCAWCAGWCRDQHPLL